MLTNHSIFSHLLRRPVRFAATLMVGLTAVVATAQAPTAPVQLQDNAPDRHTVVKGDTLWGISGKFLKTPWRWPEVWRLNKDQIKDPHWIYPGQTIYLDRNAPGGPLLSLTPPGETARGGLVRLSPQIRAEARAEQAIPSIRPDDIEPFVLRNMVIGAETLDDAPQIVKSVGERVAFSTADAVYAVGVKPEMGKVFQIFRKGRELRDPSIEPRPVCCAKAKSHALKSSAPNRKS
jgi:hypothetical protein